MLNKLMTCLVVAALTSPLMGCIVHTHDGHGPRGHVREGRAPRCHPSQYWDGDTCRHKGRGHGARKHDGRW